MEKGSPAAIPWYEDEKSYIAVRDMLPASERQDPLAYDVFRAQLEAAEKATQRKGLITYRIPVDAATVKAWCKANNRPICRKSITIFISVVLEQRLRRSGRN
jgi:hypothetical protein